MRALGSKNVLLVAVAVGAALFAVGVVGDATRGWSGLLTAGLFGIWLSLGAALLAAINIASGARWWFPLANIHIGVSRLLLAPCAAIVLVLLFGLSDVYPWADADYVAHHPLVQEKGAWLNQPMVLIRAALVIGLWLALIRTLNRKLRAVADQAPGLAAHNLAGFGALFLIVFAVTISVASWDWAMSIEPEYFSTMAGVYMFSGTFVGGIATVTLAALFLQARGELELTPKHLHDLGKLLFAFSFFWAYIWFCQYMLIWYANIPEEAGYFSTRVDGVWFGVFVLNACLNFVAPFVILLSAKAKKNPRILGLAAVIVLVGRWVDTWMLIAPSTSRSEVLFPVYALGATLAVVAVMALLLRRGHVRSEAT